MAIVTPQNAGGTGFTTYTDGQLLIGSSKDNALHRATLTASTGVTIVTGNGSITISATGLGGTVTNLTGGTNIALSPATITTTGSIAVTGPPSVTSLTANDLVLGAGTGPMVAAADWSIVSNILIGNLNTAAAPAAPLDVFFRGIQADGHGSVVELLTANSGLNVFNNIIGRQSRGTLASPTGTATNDVINQWEGRGYDATNGYAGGATGAVVISSTENWTSQAHGTNIIVYGTPKASTTVQANINANAEGVQIRGTNTNDNAPTGFTGEYGSRILGSGGAVSLTSGIATNVFQQSFGSGDWHIWGETWFNLNAASTLLTVAYCALSTASAGLPGNPADNESVNVFGAISGVGNIAVALAPMRLQVAAGSTTTLYLVVNTVFSNSTLTAYGKMAWIRPR